MRRAGALAAVLAAALAAGACGHAEGSADGGVPVTTAPSDPKPTPELPVTVASADGRDVTVEDVSRIVPLTGSLAEIVFSLGLGDRVVARDVSATFPEARHLPLVTRAHDVSAESLLSQRPTVVLAQTDTGPPEALEQVRRAGVPVVVFELPSGVEGIGARVRAVAAALGVPGAGDRLAARVRDEIARVQEAIPPDAPAPRVAFLYMRGQAGVYLIGGEGSGADSMIAAAGGIDAGTAAGLDDPFTPITTEALVGAAPDVILMTTTGLESVGGVDGLVEIPGIAQTPAGRDRRVVTVEDGLLYGFGARTPDAIAALIEGLYGGGAGRDR
ncbi:MAG: ABC transporter substrate-binding protein [Acidimicrobiia bacterium]|nr:MAG: ABC transporter substrate-binding protein [Acidimicrobiia bacterium]